MFPADLILLASAVPGGNAFIETASLDGKLREIQDKKISNPEWLRNNLPLSDKIIISTALQVTALALLPTDPYLILVQLSLLREFSQKL